MHLPVRFLGVAGFAVQISLSLLLIFSCQRLSPAVRFKISFSVH